MNLSSQRNQSNGAGLFLILTIVFLSISVWQTGIGYELMFGEHLSWVFSIAIGLMMLFLAFEMRKRRVRGESAVGPLIGYIACAIFCFFGNFNAIYSRYNRDELIKKELLNHKNELTAIVTSAKSALEKCDPASEKLEKDVNEHKGQLVIQLTDPARPGKDFRAISEIKIIQSLLGQNLTDLGGTPQQMADGYSKNIKSILETRLADSKLYKSKSLIATFDEKQANLDPIILEALKPINVSSKGQDAIFKTVDAINSIGETTKNFLGKDASFEFLRADFENQEIGKISHTFQSAFNGQNWAAAFISMLVAFAIDALVPFVIFVGTRRKEEDDEENNGRSGGGGVVVIR